MLFIISTHKLYLRQTEIVKGTVDEIIQTLPFHPVMILQLFGSTCSADKMRIHDQQIGVLRALVDSYDALARAILIAAHHDRATEFLEVASDNWNLIPQGSAISNVYDFTENLVQMIQHEAYLQHEILKISLFVSIIFGRRVSYPSIPLSPISFNILRDWASLF